MGLPKRKVVAIEVGRDGSASETKHSSNRLHGCSNSQPNVQLGESLTSKSNSQKESGLGDLQSSSEISILRSRNHKILLSHLSSKPLWLTKNQDLSRDSGLPLETVRYGLRRLEAIGCIAKTRYSNCGLKIEVLKSADELGIETQHSNLTVTADKIDRLYNKSNYLTQKDIDRLWPLTATKGFLAAQHRKLVQDFEAKGFEPLNIKQALNYVEFQLSRNALVDRRGDPVGDVPAWLIKSLRNNGYYSRPKNYESPEEQVERDRLETEVRIAELREKATAATANNWWAELSPDHPAKLEPMKGAKGSWIVHQYQKYGAEDVPSRGKENLES